MAAQSRRRAWRRRQTCSKIGTMAASPQQHAGTPKSDGTQRQSLSKHGTAHTATGSRRSRLTGQQDTGEQLVERPISRRQVISDLVLQTSAAQLVAKVLKQTQVGGAPAPGSVRTWASFSRLQKRVLP